MTLFSVDNRLLNRACEEVPVVPLNLKKKIGGKRDQDVCTMLPGDYLKAFMDPNFLGYMKTYIKTTTRGNSNDLLVSSIDIIAFICVELIIPLDNFINGLTGNLTFCSCPSFRFRPPLCSTSILQTPPPSLPPALVVA